MRTSLTLLTLLSLLLLNGCASSSAAKEESIKQRQNEAIERWHGCLNETVTRLEQEEASIDTIVKSTLFVCQGHKDDVLATFPRRLERSLNVVMTNDTRQRALHRVASIRSAEAGVMGSLYRSVVGSDRLD